MPVAEISDFIFTSWMKAVVIRSRRQNKWPLINTFVLPSRSNDRSFNSTSKNEIYTLLPSKRGIKMANRNITSLLKHIDELRILLADSPVHVLSINETRLNYSVKTVTFISPAMELFVGIERIMIDSVGVFVFIFEPTLITRYVLILT